MPVTQLPLSLPLTRGEARQLGLKHYYPGTACPLGHRALRFVSTGGCVDCCRERQKTKKVRAYQRDRYQNKREEILAQHAKRCAKNRAKRSLVSAAWARKNKEKVSQYKKRNKHARRAATGAYSERDIKRLEHIQRNCCAVCSVKLGKDREIDHIIPLTKGGTNFCGNLQLLCPTCNRRKSDRLPVVWRYKVAGMLDEGGQV